MKNLFKSMSAVLLGAFVATSAIAEDKALDLDTLLKQLEEGKYQQNQQNAQREREFNSKVAEQDRTLAEAAQTRDNELQRSERLNPVRRKRI